MDIVIAILFFFSAGVFLFAQREIRKAVPKDDRTYMDPLPGGLRIIWPAIEFLSFYVGERLPVDYLEKVNRKLKLSGVSFILTAEQYFSVRLFTMIVCCLIALFLMFALEGFSLKWLLISAAFGFFLPVITLNDLHQKRKMVIIKDLPTYLDFLTMSVQAGLNLSGAIQQAVEKGPGGPISVEFNSVLRDLRAGMTRTRALRSMAERMQVKEIDSFVNALIQAEKTGASLGETLTVQADQRRIERFQRAEKKAMEAPVKLVFPLVAFIFPVTFLVLGFPIAMKLIHGM